MNRVQPGAADSRSTRPPPYGAQLAKRRLRGEPIREVWVFSGPDVWAEEQLARVNIERDGTGPGNRIILEPGIRPNSYKWNLVRDLTVFGIFEDDAPDVFMLELAWVCLHAGAKVVHIAHKNRWTNYINDCDGARVGRAG